MQVDGKRSLLAVFANKDPTMLFDKKFSKHPDVQGLFTFFDAYKNNSNNSRRWTAAICARKLWVMSKLLAKWEEELKNCHWSAGQESERPVHDDHVKALNKLVKECKKWSVTEKERNKSTRHRTRVEDNLQEKIPFDKSNCDHRSCPYCKHGMLMRIESPDEIQAENNRIKVDHEGRIKEWNWKPTNS
jgi:hypothetical protein